LTRRALPRLVLAAVAGGLALWVALGERPAAPSGAWLTRAGVETRFATADGIRVRYVRRGSGPPVVLVHGIAASAYSWAEVIPALAASHDVIALDLPGFGGSEAPDHVSGDRYPRVLKAFLDERGLSRVHLVGHSLGGAIAATFAASEPGRVDRLVLIDSAGFNFAPSDRPWLLRVAGSPALAAMIERLPVRRRLVSLGLRQVFHDDARVTPERIEEYVGPLARPGAARLMAGLLDTRAFLGLPEAIGRIRAPTLIVWGAQDTWVPLADADRFLAAIPGARKAVIDACGHVPQEERPQELIALLREFLEENRGDAKDAEREMERETSVRSPRPSALSASPR
jgi:4,5:9,10-diseco-3-hydroxy-5,9,17-trioxoandrosta-1(10),2-diene-4-oate hydrolase